MTGNDIDGYLVRSTQDGSVEIRIADSAVQGISAEIMRGFGVTRRRGAEVGGLLFGSLNKGIIAVDSFEIVPCEYAYGPSWLLSENDQAKLAEALAHSRSGARSHHQVAGWFRSHTRDAPGPEAPDAEILHKHFSNWPAVLLLIKPFAARKPEAALYVANGSRIAAEPAITFTFSADSSTPSQKTIEPAAPAQKRELPSLGTTAETPWRLSEPQKPVAAPQTDTPVIKRDLISREATPDDPLFMAESHEPAATLSKSATPGTEHSRETAAETPPRPSELPQPAPPQPSEAADARRDVTARETAPGATEFPAEAAAPVNEREPASPGLSPEEPFLPPDLDELLRAYRRDPSSHKTTAEPQEAAPVSPTAAEHPAVLLPVPHSEPGSAAVRAPRTENDRFLRGVLGSPEMPADSADRPPRPSRDLFAAYGTTPTRRFARIFAWTMFSLSAVLFGCTLGYRQAGGNLVALLPGSSPSPARDPYALGVTAALRGDSVLIHWDRDAAVVRKALRGNLIVTSASGRHEIPLEPEEVRHGIVLYRTDATQVDVRLEIFLTPGRLIAEQAIWRRAVTNQQ